MISLTKKINTVRRLVLARETIFLGTSKIHINGIFCHMLIVFVVVFISMYLL